MPAGGVVISSSGFGLFMVDEAARMGRPVLLFFLRIQLVATAPRVSRVASYKGVTMRSFRCGVLSTAGDGAAGAVAGVMLGFDCVVGCDVGCGEPCADGCASAFAFALAFGSVGLTGGER